MNEINIKIPLHKLQDLMISHVRYSLPRHTYIVSETIHDVKTYLGELQLAIKRVVTPIIKAKRKAILEGKNE
ncbi:hypothetical protein [Haemophilus influenzae]|uniref:hypothetical protein n=1 Tax=Haemophilus influenzae TaxID=727 RepID=UPI000D01943D|nr:hypothetical protein [Haemophilus influenzae]PRJ06597.1 hypothetical protein BV025_01322 [Haemophilus influenzae]PRM45505.1 hypothetical protein BVZ64_01938 [Haemophilus influenzae]